MMGLKHFQDLRNTFPTRPIDDTVRTYGNEITTRLGAFCESPNLVRSKRFVAAWALLLGAQALGLSADQPQTLGAALFLGQQTLRARLTGHAQDLPTSAARCANCHAGPSPQGDEPVTGVTQTTRIGPALSAPTLQTALPRRGGPASRYDESTFCRALQDGIDPAWVQLKRAMPRYRLSASECRGLWVYLTMN
jgi:hypothetical protein